MSLVLALLLAAQQLQVQAMVDRRDVELGDELTFTITVEAAGNEPVEIEMPVLDGLELRGSNDRREVSIRSGAVTRVITRELRLAPTRTGIVRVGAVEVRVGAEVASSGPVTISVSSAGEITATTLHPRIRTMIERRSPPALSPDNVTVEILTSADTIVLGDQVDLAVVAWFPREIRSRLRNPPTMNPPALRGVWAYPHPGPGAVALSRRIAGTWYDVYVHHQVVFPLTPGVLEVEPATVAYSLPLSYSFLSREVRHEPQSGSLRLVVRPQPVAGRPARFDGAAARDLEFTVTAEPRELRVGEAGLVTATLRGRGNVALWPEPHFTWPPGFRVYPERVRVDLGPDEQGIAGTKRFDYVVVVGEPGTHRVPSATYPYFDLSTRRYREIHGEPLEFVTDGAPSLAASDESEGGRTLMAGRPLSRLFWLVEAAPLWLWLLILTGPPLLVLGWRVSPRMRPRRTRRRLTSERPLERLASDFRRSLQSLVEEAEVCDGDALANALRAAGVEEPVAQHAARVRDRLWQANYGPAGEIDPDELAAEVQEVLRALPAEDVWSTKTMTTLVLVAACLLVGAPLTAQSAERLYEMGAVGSAADSFALRAAHEPWSAAHWYNLGDALERGGNRPLARRAWLRAARLDPRRREIREALRSVPAPDGVSRRLTWVSPVAPTEAALVAALLWILGWVLVAARRYARAGVVVLAAALAIGSYGVYVTRRYAEAVALVRTDDTRLRPAPYGPANTNRLLSEGSAVVVDREMGSWVLVRRGHEAGWLLRDEIVRL